MQYPSEENDYQAAHAALLRHSYHKLLGQDLLANTFGSAEFARALFEAPFAVVSHGIEEDPVFNYANLKALELFGMKWSEFVLTPSRYSAEPVNREERKRLLDQVNRRGFIDNYRGVRISKQGRRFLIKNAVVWNLLDEQNHYRGQAACFGEWEFLNRTEKSLQNC